MTKNLTIIMGTGKNQAAAAMLIAVLKELNSSGTLYLGYPLLATADEPINVDAILVSADHGIVAFRFSDESPSAESGWEDLIADQDRLFTGLEAHLRRYESLRQRRGLAFEINTVTLFPNQVREVPDTEGAYLAFGDLAQWLQGLDPLDGSLVTQLLSVLQRVTNIKPMKRRVDVSREGSRGSKLKIIEKSIANLDRWQQAAAIETPDGPQRIRGLAGSGKTVVLALKAAFLHAKNPGWDIAFTFQSRALYQQIDDLITRFTFEHMNDRPDASKLQVLHSWGSASKQGIYSRIATSLNAPVRDFAYASGVFGRENAFQGICKELLDIARGSNINPLFDAVLIDEAQDFPPEFFQLIYLFTREPKRIIWGFDELQKLSDSMMPDTDELFGVGDDGESLVSLHQAENAPQTDIVLPVCYRNTPWALAVAHGLGIGVYRTDGLVQHPDNPRLWSEIGYEVKAGKLELGEHVSLQRSSRNTPEYFRSLLVDRDALSVHHFTAEEQQDRWVAEQIRLNLSDDELEADDILVVLPDAYTAKSRAAAIISNLSRIGIPAHLVGVNSSQDEVFREGSVALTHIHRAKGNEAPMVYVMDVQRTVLGQNQVSRRNTLFTAITRSRAWVRVCGFGPKMAVIEDEIQKIVNADYKLDFRIPSAEALNILRHKEEELPSTDSPGEGILEQFLAALESGSLSLDDIPAEIRARNPMRRLLTDSDE
ncbi:DEAD/DEAH box helicase [Arthrobacter sp. ISL-72]|uniref:DEAD/DEAH box helicase n=1 Tax=Arthrobacter sp. ISL-72 TaxID=2819114 RepID=UPI001BEA5E26|nr:ATP-binding domain-containing protein [Arthrobacter sp. ISL-72]MBT2596219.1 DEAD/DEAH box helicase [Arthrobacter sp. ISL-72]